MSTESARTLFVTGGASGIGLAASRYFHARGWHVIVADVDGVAAVKAAQNLGDRAAGVAVDVTDQHALLATFAAALDDGQQIDGLVTSAGITRIGAAAELAPQDWRHVIDVDLTGTFLTCQAAYPFMRRGSAVVTIASIAGLRPLPGRAAYCAAKAGVISLTEVLAAEWASEGIRVNCVAPGWVDTPFLRASAARGVVDLDELAARPPLGGLATVEDIGSAIAYLVSAEARFVTGQTIAVDGGWSRAR